MKKCNFIKTLVLFAALSGNVLADLNDGLVAYYPFNGDAKDASGNGNDGTVNGATLTEDRFGNKESAYNFDKYKELIQLPHTILDGLTEFTFSIHLKLFDNSKVMGILSGANSNTHDETLLLFYALTLTPYIKGSRFETSATINSNKWTHIAWVHSGSSGKTIIYVDGIPEKTVVTNKLGAVKISPNGLWLGNDQDTVGGTWDADQQFLGIMDDISFYNRILSESEIQQLYKPIEDEKPPIEISSKATYYSKNKTLYLESILVPFIDEFSGE